jgi:hypothetical protein
MTYVGGPPYDRDAFYCGGIMDYSAIYPIDGGTAASAA